VTARDRKSGVAACGDTKSIALARLAEALRLHEGGGDPTENEEVFLREVGIDPDAIDVDASPPPWFQ
jgi:hypothetical protein